MKKLFLVNAKDKNFGIYYLSCSTKDKFTLKNIFTDEDLTKPMSKYSIVKYLENNNIKRLSEKDTLEILKMIKDKVK